MIGTIVKYEDIEYVIVISKGVKVKIITKENFASSSIGTIQLTEEFNLYKEKLKEIKVSNIKKTNFFLESLSQEIAKYF